VFDQAAGAGEAGWVAGLGQDRAGADRGQPGDGLDQFGEPERVEHADHAGLDAGQLGTGVGEVVEGEPDPFQRPRALPGDLLFYRQDTDHMPYHSMIFVGPSYATRDRERYIVYHTGNDGIIKRLTADELLNYPEPDWRPRPSNPYFLGVYRWNILRNVP
jgi:hypothetical protein